MERDRWQSKSISYHRGVNGSARKFAEEMVASGVVQAIREKERDRMSDAFLEQSLALLEEIQASPEKLEWCRRYSVYDTDRGQDELARSLYAFEEQAKANGLVIKNYHQVIQQYRLDEDDVINVPSSWLKEQSYLTTLACISYHFRRDHFSEGFLISESIASGAMLRMLRHLKFRSFGTGVATTLETLYGLSCQGIPDVPGVYWVLAPEGFPIHFEAIAFNPSAPPYCVDVLMKKYAACKDKRILYIGKASGKKGLHQRLQQYMKYGWNKAVNHKGGRAIWQIQNAGMLLLTYEPCPDCVERERQLLRDYRAANGCYPLANWRG